MVLSKKKSYVGRRGGTPIDLDHYVPSFITTIANKWSSSSSELYRRKYDIGIVEWRLMALLANEPWIQASRVDAVVGMDKAAVSRGVRPLEQRGLIQTRPNEVDPRRKEMALTPEGRKLHDKIAALALARQEQLLCELKADERRVLLDILRRVLIGLRGLRALDDRLQADQSGERRRASKSGGHLSRKIS
jgi:DNA-binding MarR family transcriptional regulator